VKQGTAYERAPMYFDACLAGTRRYRPTRPYSRSPTRWPAHTAESNGCIAAAGTEVPAMIGKFVTDAVLAAIIVAALLAVAAILR
jgi:hypothetical protein